MPHPEVRKGPMPRNAEEEYDEELRYLDEQLARVLALVGDRAMIVVFADHGESFGAHRVAGAPSFRHGHTLYEELIHVPLVFVAPGLAPRVLTQPVGLIDLAPTVLDVLGVPIPSSFRGRSLAGALVGEPLAPEAVKSELLPQQGWNTAARMLLDADGRSKIIYRLTQPRVEVYDVVADPNEQRELSVIRPRQTAELMAEMAAWQDSSNE
jgi:arylsulfatase A-like enzyme